MGEATTSNHVKVLVVDDEPVICSLVADTLQNDGQEVVWALNGTQGLKLAKEGLISPITARTWVPRRALELV